MKKTLKSMAMAIATVMTFGSIVFTSCNKAEEIVTTDYSSQPAVKTLTLSDAQRIELSRRLAIAMNGVQDSYNQLNNAIDTVCAYGIGEKLYMYDIFSTATSKFLPTNTPLNRLRAAISNSNILEDCGVQNDQYYGQLQFYWPYHDEWDSTTNPVVIFVPSNPNPAYVVGFVIDHWGELATRTFNVRTLHTLPHGSLVFIKEAEFHYNWYPNFRDGENTNQNGSWIPLYDIVDQYGDACFENDINGNDTLVEASVTKFKSGGTFYDGWLQDDCEFSLSFVRINQDGAVVTSTYNFEMTRKQIENESIHMLGCIFAPRWPQECEEIYYRLVERDSWGWSGHININLSHGGSTITTELNINTTDDSISAGILDRADYIDRCINESGVYPLGSDVLYFKTRLYSSPSF